MMERFSDPALWIEAAIILVVGVFILTVVLRTTNYLARRAHITPLAVRPVRVVIRWFLILLICGLLINKLFAVDLMNMIVGVLALVAIGVVAVWSLLSHTTATMLLILLKPFRIHDWINFPGEDVAGRVIDLNLFYTLLDNEKGEHFIIPNNTFFQKTFRHVPGKNKEKIELHEQLDRTEPAQAN